ncbi:MAG: ACT domain-containing protein, partial [Candidatus Micrarchaeota archaeon]
MREITIVARDRVGLLADISELLATNGVNVDSLTTETANSTAVVRLVVSGAAKAKVVLETSGFKVMESDVLVVRLADKPGELAKVARVLSEDRVNIHNVFMLSKTGEETLLALKVSNYDAA